MSSKDPKPADIVINVVGIPPSTVMGRPCLDEGELSELNDKRRLILVISKLADPHDPEHPSPEERAARVMARRPEVRDYYDAAVRNGTCRRAADNLAIQIEQEAEARRLGEQPESIEESVNRIPPPVYDVPGEGARKWKALVDAERGSFAERSEAALVAWAKRRPGWDWINKPPPQNEILAAHRKDFGTIPGLSDKPIRAVRRALAPDEAKRGGRHFHRG